MAALLAVAGCAAQPQDLSGVQSVELVAVPFFPQSSYQCGPAALATVLSHSGVATAPDDLVPRVYLPGRQGSLQIELKAATRSSGRLPFELMPDVDALFAEVAQGRPVLVLQNLGLSWLPRWHYAVVVGYDAERRAVLLRSGTQKRRAERLRRFVRSWSLAEYWGFVVLRPGELPARGSPDRYLRTIADSETALQPEVVSVALINGATAWPEHADLSFAAANQLRKQREMEAAAGYFRRTLALEPAHIGALNNYADLLLGQGCLVDARGLIDRAQISLQAGSPFEAVVTATRQAIASAAAAGKANAQPCERLAPAP